MDRSNLTNSKGGLQRDSMSLEQLSAFASKGTTEAMLVDFLLAVRASVKGISGRVASLIEKYSTDAGSHVLDLAGFTKMCVKHKRAREKRL